jgi:hypothetical protein
VDVPFALTTASHELPTTTLLVVDAADLSEDEETLAEVEAVVVAEEDSTIAGVAAAAEAVAGVEARLTAVDSATSKARR